MMLLEKSLRTTCDIDDILREFLQIFTFFLHFWLTLLVLLTRPSHVVSWLPHYSHTRLLILELFGPNLSVLTFEIFSDKFIDFVEVIVQFLIFISIPIPHIFILNITLWRFNKVSWLKFPLVLIILFISLLLQFEVLNLAPDIVQAWVHLGQLVVLSDYNLIWCLNSLVFDRLSWFNLGEVWLTCRYSACVWLFVMCFLRYLKSSFWLLVLVISSWVIQLLSKI